MQVRSYQTYHQDKHFLVSSLDCLGTVAGILGDIWLVSLVRQALSDIILLVV